MNKGDRDVNESGQESGKKKPIAQRHADGPKWTLSRIEVRTSVSGEKWPIARVELHEDARGRVTDIATAPGAFEAMFKAAGQILEIAPAILSYNVCSSGHGKDQSLIIRIDVELELDGRVCRGSSSGSDLVRCSLLAWLDAASGFRVGTAGNRCVRTRPFQVSGIDENDDLWVFASSDEGAAKAIEKEFMAEGYTEIRLLV